MWSPFPTFSSLLSTSRPWERCGNGSFARIISTSARRSAERRSADKASMREFLSVQRGGVKSWSSSWISMLGYIPFKETNILLMATRNPGRTHTSWAIGIPCPIYLRWVFYIPGGDLWSSGISSSTCMVGILYTLDLPPIQVPVSTRMTWHF